MSLAAAQAAPSTIHIEVEQLDRMAQPANPQSVIEATKETGRENPVGS